jgi:hypothetical protein
MNVFIYALGALIDRMSPKVDPKVGEDASKNQLQLGGSTPRSNIIISILRQHNTPIPHSLDTDAKPC